MIYKMSLVLALALAFGLNAFAGPQQDKMKSCNEQAAGKKGDERKMFMKTCLSSAPAAPGKSILPPVPPPPAAAPKTPQERMKVCNAEAKGKSGAERKAFMSQCLKAQ